MYIWREIFRLYIESKIFQGTASVEKSKYKMQGFVEEIETMKLVRVWLKIQWSNSMFRFIWHVVPPVAQKNEHKNVQIGPQSFSRIECLIDGF
jgi:hypothetical protein